MTNGSSQGLFVVVAVVVFGIFVAISYLLFRDNLKPSLSSIFSDTILKTKDVSINLYDVSDFEDVYDVGIDYNNIITVGGGNNAIPLSDNNSEGVSLLLSSKDKGLYYGIGVEKNDKIREDTYYKVVFRIEMLEGNATKIGGHNTGFSNVYSVNINGIKHTTNWLEPLDTSMLEGNEYNVEFVMKTRKEFNVTDANSPIPKFFIQLNRGVAGTSFKYNINNLKLVEVKPKLEILDV